MSYTSNIQQARIEQLARNILSITDNLKGNVEAKDFVNFPLALFFYRFISENLVFFINEHERQINLLFDYQWIRDQAAEQLLQTVAREKWFFLLPSQLFGNVHKMARNEHLLMIPKDVFANIKTSAKETDYIPNYSKKIMANLKNFYYYYLTPTEKWRWDNFLFRKDFDLNSPELGETIRERNGKLIEIMDLLACIQIYDLVKETINYKINEILDLQLDIHCAIDRIIKKHIQN